MAKPFLTKDSIRKIRRMIKAILREPELFSQNTFCRRVSCLQPDGLCNTVSCAAGWAIWIDNPEKYLRMVRKTLKSIDTGIGLFPNWEQAGLDALGLNFDWKNGADRDRVRTFFGSVSDYPRPFRHQYLDAVTDLERAQVAAARWEKFIETDGRV